MEHLKDSDKLREEAVQWLLRTRVPHCNQAEKQACEQWLAQSSLHRSAYAKAESQYHYSSCRPETTEFTG